jgi:hypothetical protein
MVTESRYASSRSPSGDTRRWRSACGTPLPHRIDLRNDLGDTELQQVFCHELVHAVLDEMKHKISYDEKFVDNFGSLLQQALTSFDSNPR